jgi:N-acetylglucosaminyldiphosphoundecaprenol N-acetyl-beta-D-mannosaminyltransferase
MKGKYWSRRVRICGVPVDSLDMQGALAVVELMVESPGPASAVIAINPEKIIAARSNLVLMEQIAKAGLLIPDGIGVVWAARLLGLGPMGRVPGAELMPEICALAARKGYRVFLFGGAKEVNDKCCGVLQKRYPGLVIAGRADGFVSEERMPDLVRQIDVSNAQILFLALGSPRQELWMQKYIASLSKVKICQGVGGTFDVIAGKVVRAPRIVQLLNLEWFYRLVMNPSRIRRQTALPKFVWLVANRVVGRDAGDCYEER